MPYLSFFAANLATIELKREPEDPKPVEPIITPPAYRPPTDEEHYNLPDEMEGPSGMDLE